MDGQLGDRRQGRATRSFARRLAPAIALALGLGGVLVHSRTGAGAPQAPAPAAAPAVWVQRSFLVGGWCIGSAAVPENLVALDAAGLDFLTDEDQAPGRRIVGVFAARMDSLRRARPGMRMRALLFLRRQPPQPGDFTANPDPRANRDALAATFREPELAGPGVAGWGLWDEPCDSSSIAHAVDLVRLVRSLPQTRGGIPLINLFPIPPPRGGQCYEGPFHDAGATRPARYAAYLDAYLGAFGPDEPPAPLLCFDDYPFAGDTLSGEYFECLRIASERCLHYSRPGQPIPLWVVVQTSPWKPKGGAWRPEPLAAQTRWQVWTALAYGAKGISYWTAGPAYAEFVGSGWGPGLLDFAGRRTGRYAAIAALNRTLHALGPTLMQLDLVRVSHVDPGVQVGVDDQRLGLAGEVHGRVRAVRGTGSGDCTVGWLRHRGTGDDYLVVVNRSLTRSRRFDVALDSRVTGVERIDPLTGRARPVAGPTSVLHTAVVGPADGALFHLVGRAAPN